MRRSAWLPSLLATILGTALGITVSILWIDLPLARYLATFGEARRVFSSPYLTQPMLVTAAWAGLVLGLGFLLFARSLPRPVEAVMLASVALLVGSLLTHDLLKPMFGRTYPSIYVRWHHSAFHLFFQHGRLGSFPSGHATEMAAMLTVAWVYYPRWRWVCAAVFALLTLALMLGQWHYLSDVLAGGVVGSAVAAAVLGIWRKLRA